MGATPKRVYLDTAVLYDIVDGNKEPRTVSRFQAALDAAEAILVISLAHYWDFYQRADPQTRARTINEIERLGVWRVLNRPEEIEQLRLGASMSGQPSGFADDLRLVPAENLNQLCHEAEAELRVVVEQARGMAGASNLGSAAHRRGPRHNKATFIRAAKAKWHLVLQNPAAEAEQVRAQVATEFDGDLDEFFGSMYENNGIPVSAKWWKAAASVAPGLFLAKKLAIARGRDHQRKHQKSDWPDREHASHLPYMDFATVDSGNYNLVMGALREVTPTPQVKVFKNRGFDALIEELEAVA